MADIFEEVEEGLRQDKLSQAWKKYGIFAYLAAALIVGGVGLNEYLQYQSKLTVEKNASRLEAALIDFDERNYEVAADALTEMTTENISLSSAAAHYLAGVRLDGNGDAEAAADVLLQAAGDADTPTTKLALLKAAYIKADTLNRVELESFLSPVTDEAGNFGALAKELIAAKALQEGDVQFARREFNALKLSQNVPSGVLLRAEQALAAMPAIPDAAPEPEPETESEPETQPAEAVRTEAEESSE